MIRAYLARRRLERAKCIATLAIRKQTEEVAVGITYSELVLYKPSRILYYRVLFQ